MSDTEFTVNAYDHAVHRDALEQFLSAVYKGVALERRVQLVDWIEERHPLRDRKPLRNVIMDGDKMVATMGHLPCDFLVAGNRLPARYTHDLLVDPTYRGKGFAKMVVNKAIEPGEFLPGGMWMTGPCYKLHVACGFADAPALVTRTLVLDPDAFTARKQMSGMKEKLGKTALALIRKRALGRTEKVTSTSPINCRDIEQFDAAMDEHWLELLRSYRAAMVRDAALLNWKYMDHPVLDYRACVAESGGKPAGFAIWRRSWPEDPERRAVIPDFVVADGDTATLERLVAHVIRDVGGTDAAVLSTLSTQPWAARLLRSFGFMPRGETQTWVAANWNDHLPDEVFANEKSWHTVMGDSDGDYWTGSV